MKILLRFSAIALVVPAFLGTATTASAVAHVSDCTIEITGGRVAIREGYKATASVVRTVRRGTLLVSPGCYTAIGRGEGYVKCGAQGWDWYLVEEGYVPITCASRI